MGRLNADFLERVESFCDRVVHVAAALNDEKTSRRIIDQLIGCGTSVGANVFEADEAVSRADFRRCLGIASKELSETRFWLRLIGRHNWLPAARLDGLEQETMELLRILGAMIVRSKEAKS